MLRGLGWLLAVLLLVFGCWWLYTHVAHKGVSGNGDVFTHNVISDSSDTKAPSDIDGNSTRDDTPAPPAQPFPGTDAAATPAPAAIPAAVPATTPAAPAATTAATPASLPTSDSIERNPPNGMAFGGGGKYQWYRQGNITWRIDTHSGTSCIDFATMEEWSKPVVYSHGCGRS